MSGSQSCLDVAAFQSLRSDVLADPVLVSALSLVAAELEINSPQTQARTLQEWREWLSDQGFEDVDIDAYVDRLKSLGLSDDEMAMVGSHSASTRSLIEGLNSLGSGLLARVLNLLDEAAAQSADVSSVAGGVGSFRGAMHKKQPRSASALGQVGSHSSNRYQELEKKEFADLVHDTAPLQKKHEFHQFEPHHQAPIEAKNLHAEAGRHMKEEKLADHGDGLSAAGVSEAARMDRGDEQMMGATRGDGLSAAGVSEAARMDRSDEQMMGSTRGDGIGAHQFADDEISTRKEGQFMQKERKETERADVGVRKESFEREKRAMYRGDEQMMGATRDSASQSQPEKRKLFTRIKNAIKNIVDS